MKVKEILMLVFFGLISTGLFADVLEDSGVKGGLVVSVGGDAEQFSTHWENDSFIFQCLETSDEKVAALRKTLQQAGVYGKVSARKFNGKDLPYADNMVNLLIVDAGFSSSEIKRVLVPGGTAIVGGKKAVKPVPSEIDDWSHYLQGADNNAVAEDSKVGTPRRMKWVGAPIRGRSHEFNSSLCAMVSAGGRLFYIFDDGLPGMTDEPIPARWMLTTRDAFNGKVLWKIPMPEWGAKYWKTRELRKVPKTVPRRLAATADKLFITMGYSAPVSALDAATGKTLATYEPTAGALEIRVAEGVLLARLEKSLVAIDTGTGAVLWDVQGEIEQDMAAISEGKAFYQNGTQLVCCDLKTGKVVWQIEEALCRQMLVHDGRLLIASKKNGKALSVETGETIWSVKGKLAYAAMFVTGNRLWFGGVTSIDVRTGKEPDSVDWSDVLTKGHHSRCYPPRAAEKFVVMTERGAEFVSLTGGENAQNDWIRGGCTFGVMPCNGLLYVPPDPCFCYPGVKLPGFLALSPEPPRAAQGGVALEKGPAYGAKMKVESGKDDWSTFRNSPSRHGSSKTKVPTQLSSVWKFKVGTTLTQSVVAGGKVFVAAKDTHMVYALDENSGKQLWTYTAGGRIDSPPTIHNGLVLFGSADGRVHCLRATDGELVWTFRAARDDRMLMAFGQLESPQRVHGSVLVEQGTAYFTAGRSTKLDGGIALYGLDPQTGEVKYSTILDNWSRTRDDAVGKPFIPAYHMEGAFSDVLSSEGGSIFLGQYQFDLTLKQQEVPYVLPEAGTESGAMAYEELKDKPYDGGMDKMLKWEKVQYDWQWRVQSEMMKNLQDKFGGASMGDRKFGRHVFSTSGFLDDSWFNRTFWMYSESWPGFYIANRGAKTGQLLTVDEEKTYVVQTYTRRNLQSPSFMPGDRGYLLYADANDNEPILPNYTRGIPKGIGFTRKNDPAWFQWIPVRVRAMTATDDALFIAGPPDVIDPDDIMGSIEGRMGGVLWAVSKKTGEKLAEIKLDTMPVFDGMSAANGKLYLSNIDGELQCFGE